MHSRKKRDIKREALREEILSQMVDVSGGEYEVGADPKSIEYIKTKEIVHGEPILAERLVSNVLSKVRLSPFKIAKFPVTNRQFEIIIPRHNRSHIGPEDEHPVVDVTYVEALKFCEVLQLRLPTEAEWEAAARGKSNKIAANSDAPDHKMANFWPSKGLNKMGDYPPNDLGLYDMTGNVYQFTSAKMGNTKLEDIVAIRGGCWGACANGTLVAMRAFMDSMLRSSRTGFRVAL